jgi:cytochrome P450
MTRLETVEDRMRMIPNMISAAARRLALLSGGTASLFQILFVAIEAAFGSGGTAKERITNALTTPQAQRHVFDVLRAFLPNLMLSRQFITSYPNQGTAIVTRYEDVVEVLSRDWDFEVVYQPRMAEITGGENFFLGMQDTPRYTRDVSNMRIAVRRSDVTDIIAPFAARKAEEIVGAAGGRIDVPKDLTLRIPAMLMAEYFGTPGPSEQKLIQWTTIMFWYLFIDLANNASVGSSAREAAQECRDYLDGAIRDRKSTPSARDDILSRCLTMQAAKLPGMDDLGIRNNLIGLIIGAIPTTSKAAVQALDQLLDRPQVLAAAQRAARAGDDRLLASYVFEALRFNPVNPLIYRRAARDAVIAGGTLRARTIPKGTMVLAANISAMFDPMKLDSPNEFRAGRAADNYILWGSGLHTCFGAHINQAMIPAVLKPLLKTTGLRRASGTQGFIDTADTPFPAHLIVEFDLG